jgi:hypothetical protein
MTDTPPEIERMLREKMMALSGEMHFVMGAQMFDSALEMVKASSRKTCQKRKGDAYCSNASTERKWDQNKLIWA